MPDAKTASTIKNIQNKHIYLYPWETVVAVFWNKYPNPFQPHVIRVDTIARRINVEEQVYQSIRLLSLRYNLPSWAKVFCNSSIINAFALEKSTCSLKDKKLTLKSQNITLSNILFVNETCQYTSEDSYRNPITSYTQNTSFKIFGLGYLSSTFERFLCMTFKTKSEVGRKVILDKIKFYEDQKSTFNSHHANETGQCAK
ncbi:PRELI domain containing protein 3A-like [Hylaeus volcanicus]|uniref:PRELI domain containing protein 3A-like n=1 Tax=Hylaeus volcanicus TaxID=313075 RepID=UPI0023B81F3E|nr:PRELI domain containing protein 3A-like [Hylaeus volcanicus]